MSTNRALIVDQLKRKGISPKLTDEFIKILINGSNAETQLVSPGISVEILWCVALALGVSRTIVRLDLTGVFKDGKDVERYRAVAHILDHNRAIKVLILNNCSFSLEGAKLLAPKLEKSSLNTLTLKGCVFAPEAKEILKQAMKTNYIHFEEEEDLVNSDIIEDAEELLDLNLSLVFNRYSTFAPFKNILGSKKIDDRQIRSSEVKRVVV